MARIIAVCTSKERDTGKTPSSLGVFEEDYGLIGDARADPNTRCQVSLLPKESIERMRQLGLDVGPGDFAENLTTEGIDLISLPIGTRAFIGEEVILEVTQIGEEHPVLWTIGGRVVDGLLPKEGIFARVVCGGVVRAGDEIRVEGLLPPWMSHDR